MLVCLGPPNTWGGLYHVALVSPSGAVRLEHASRDCLATPATREDLTGEALAAVLELLAAPPLCCNLPRLRRPRSPAATSSQRLCPYARPRARRRPRSTGGVPPWRFPPFPVALPAGTYRAPPLSIVLRRTPSSEQRLFLGASDRPLVPPRPYSLS